jgi:hypothetical protein
MGVIRDAAEKFWNGEITVAMQHPLLPTGEFEEVAAGVVFYRWFANMVAVKSEEGLVLVDTGAYFNQAAGGPEGGPRYLLDSNLDWGQDWSRLGCEAMRRGWRPMAYIYLGAGNPHNDIPEAVDALDSTTPPNGGFLAVSSYAAAVGVPYLRALRYRNEAARLDRLLEFARRQGTVVGEVGHTITVYRLPVPRPQAPPT